MKQKDIATFMVVGIISAIISVALSNLIITPSKIKSQEAEIVEPITSTFPVPTSKDKFFNKDSINPTKLIQIGEDNNETPFGPSN